MTLRAALRALAMPAVLLTACSKVALVGVVDDDAGPDDAGNATVAMQDASNASFADAAADAQARSASVRIDDCTAATTDLTPADIGALAAGGTVTPDMRWLYPYDQTIFPEGVGAPMLMWDGPEPRAVYVRLYGGDFDYTGCLRVDAARRVQLPERVWSLAETATHGRTDPLTLELTSISGSVVTGPIRQQLTIADGRLTGAVYYMSYGSATQVNTAAPTVLRVRPGAAAESVFAATSCVGCHVVARDGGDLLAFVDGRDTHFALPEQTSAMPVARSNQLAGTELAALTPDGALYASPAHPANLGPRSYGPQRSVGAGLYETATGLVVADSGIPDEAMMPMFSGDGALLAFSDAANAAGRSLSLMRFSVADRRASDYRVLVTTDRYTGWPTFVPSNAAIVFAQSDAADASGGGFGHPVTMPRVTSSDLYALALSADAQPTGQTVLLARAMGFLSEQAVASSTTYLPFGADDLHRNYYPHVSPEPVGGYYWLFFDSVRHYGNQGRVRQIWVAALDPSLAGPANLDGSHPAFRLSGQEVTAANMRPIMAARQ